jgi:protein-L-isoaspartate(D-aspartate) O-methyltransferase
MSLAFGAAIREKPAGPERVMTSFAASRRNMVDNQLRTFDVSDRAVLAAMAEVPRERFVPDADKALAYLDRNLVLGSDGADMRVLLAPMTFARLIQALDIQDGERVLDVGGGYGYGAAVLEAMGAKVTLLESRADLAEGAKERLGSDVAIVTGPLEDGAADRGPFGKILVNGTLQMRPDALLAQLAENGLLACLVDENGTGRAVLFVKSAAGIGQRTLLDASAPTLAAFRPEPAFTF